MKNIPKIYVLLISCLFLLRAVSAQTLTLTNTSYSLGKGQQVGVLSGGAPPYKLVYDASRPGDSMHNGLFTIKGNKLLLNAPYGSMFTKNGVKVVIQENGGAKKNTSFFVTGSPGGTATAFHAPDFRLDASTPNSLSNGVQVAEAGDFDNDGDNDLFLKTA